MPWLAQKLTSMSSFVAILQEPRDTLKSISSTNALLSYGILPRLKLTAPLADHAAPHLGTTVLAYSLAEPDLIIKLA